MANALPHWDVSGVYPSLESPEYEAGFGALARALDDLEALFERHALDKQPPKPFEAPVVVAFEAALSSLNGVLEQMTLLEGYVYAFVSTNSRDQVALRELSNLEQQGVRLSVLATRFTAWIGSQEVERLVASSQAAAAHAFFVRKAAEEARHLMSPAEEELAAKLNLTGSSAWTNLYEKVVSQIMVPLERDGALVELPMTMVRNLAFDPDRDVRRRAYEAELSTWKAREVPILAALNSIKGQTNTLTKRRQWASPLDEALFGSNIDRGTLDAMMAAARDAFPDFRRYLKAKARALGVESLAWYDLFAPVGGEGREWPYEEGSRFVVEQFGTYSAKMAGLAAQALAENWIDAEPREGKQGGAFCMRLRPGESRILCNYAPVYSEVSTLAHELGHAYHNLTQRDRTPAQRRTPMTLAETASIFCETVVKNAVLAQVSPTEQYAILESSLQSDCQVVVDITSRFLFEQSLFHKRQGRELSAEELCELMLEAQRQTYGDGLDPQALHPYMWAVKSHYYGMSFYNYPYMFGQLFGTGLYAQYLEDPEGFKEGYDDLLSSTGMASATDLAARFGIDIRQPAFWASSLDVIRADIDRFESLVGEMAGG